MKTLAYNYRVMETMIIFICFNNSIFRQFSETQSQMLKVNLQNLTVFECFIPNSVDFAQDELIHAEFCALSQGAGVIK